GSATTLSLQPPSPFCHPERTQDFLLHLLSSATPDVVLFKENHTQPTEAATLDRKSEDAEGPAVRHSCAPLLPVHNLQQSSPNPPEHTKLRLSFGFPAVVRGTADPSLRSPGFLLRWVALANFMRLPLRERRTRNRVQRSVAGNPGRDDKKEGGRCKERAVAE